MKIGILTHHYINNFGAFLQTYALCEVVKGLYPDAEVYVINYVNKRHFITNTLGWFRVYQKENISGWIEKIGLPRTFSQARRKYLNMTVPVSDADAINRLGFDTIIVGSDEVWNYADKKAYNPIKFGVGLDCRNLVAYAPSCGQAFSKLLMPEYAREGLKSYKSLSARDSDTYNMLCSLGFKAKRVVDPTFLTKIPTEPVKVKKPYILFYYCDNLPHEELNEIINYAKENKLALYGAGECNKIYDRNTINLTPFQWNEMFKNANAVVTGTFHGVVFSIINKRDFVCYMSNPSRIAKVNSLLDEFNLSDRKVKNRNTVELINTTIDYDKVYRIVDAKREESIRYLRESIQNGRKKDYSVYK
ncbi:MAG: polysaccharide pyruvyl transferase family protein [Candidatus Ornithomonoglobus sp.]